MISRASRVSSPPNGNDPAPPSTPSPPRFHQTQVSIMCVELVARDVHDLWRLFHDKLRWVVENAESALEGADPQEAQRVLDRFKASYDEKYPRVRDFLAGTAELLSIYGIRLRTRMEEAHNWVAIEEKGAGAEEGEVAVEAEGGDGGDGGEGAARGKGQPEGEEEE